MAKQLLGKEVTAAMNAKLQERVAALKEKGVSPKLAIVRCGENPSDLSYEKGATARAELISEHEPHRAVMLVMADRLNATVRRITDTMYHSADEFLEDLRVVQRSLAACGAVRADGTPSRPYGSRRTRPAR